MAITTVIKVGNVCLSNIGVVLFLGLVILQSASLRHFVALNENLSTNIETATTASIDGGDEKGGLIASNNNLLLVREQQQQRDQDDEQGVVRVNERRNLINSRGQEHGEDVHSSSVAVLDLLDWEIKSLEKPYDQSCSDLPPQVDDVCCLGTQSHTGKIKIQRRYLCDHLTLQDYQQLQYQAQQYLQQQQQQLDDNDNTSMMACDVCQIVEFLRKNQHLKFAYFGDSMTNQVEQAMVCELQRRNYVVTQQQVQFDKRNDQFRSIMEYRRRTIRSPLWEETDEVVIMDFLFQYRLPIQYPEQQELIANTYDMLIFNMGLHWVYHTTNTTINHSNQHHKQKKNKKNRWTRRTYGRQLTIFFNLIRQAGRVKVLAYRETSATHFDAPGGEYSLARQQQPNYDTSTCVPHDNYREHEMSNVSGWREPIVRQAAQAANYTIVEMMATRTKSQQQQPQQPELYVIPFYDFTSHHWAFHPHREGPNAHLDCSHFCSSPFLFQPIWRAIRLAMDRKFGLG